MSELTRREFIHHPLCILGWTFCRSGRLGLSNGESISPGSMPLTNMAGRKELYPPVFVRP